MGLNYKDKKKDVYFDGHERADVRAYRDDFIARMFGFAKFMELYGDTDENELNSHQLFNGDTEFVWVTHDEACFWANDDVKYELFCFVFWN
jgi:hypothetical protein